MDLDEKPELSSASSVQETSVPAIKAKPSVGFERGFFFSLIYAMEGILYCVKTQRNFRIHLTLATIALFMAVYFSIGLVQWAILWGVIGLVLFAELMNSAVELMVDTFTQGRFDLRAKAIKDMAAGAVLVTAISALAIGMCIFTPYLLELFQLG